MIERLDGMAPQEKVCQQLGVELENVVELLAFKHIFSHITWEMTSYKAQMKVTDSLPSGYMFFQRRK